MTLPDATVVATTMASVNAIFTAFPIISTVIGIVILSGVAFGMARKLRGLGR